jgi:hypothetical protein
MNINIPFVAADRVGNVTIGSVVKDLNHRQLCLLDLELRKRGLYLYVFHWNETLRLPEAIVMGTEVILNPVN